MFYTELRKENTLLDSFKIGIEKSFDEVYASVKEELSDDFYEEYFFMVEPRKNKNIYSKYELRIDEDGMSRSIQIYTTSREDAEFAFYTLRTILRYIKSK